MLRDAGPDQAMTGTEVNNLNTAALAYVGDAVYELAVRSRLLQKGTIRADRLHKTAKRYVCAAGQARIIRSIFDELTEEEQRRVKRYRNFRNHSRAKNTDVMTYSWATAFEALAGFFYLSGDAQRLDWLFERAFSVMEEQKQDGSDVIRKEKEKEDAE